MMLLITESSTAINFFGKEYNTVLSSINHYLILQQDLIQLIFWSLVGGKGTIFHLFFNLIFLKLLHMLHVHALC